MAELPNPALQALRAQINPELVLAQVRIRKTSDGFVLCHVEDAGRDPASLRKVAGEELRVLAQTTEQGIFRPLKSAPNLPCGWETHVRNSAELGRALEHLYPGGVADWFAAQAEPVPATHYREFTGRQSGMFRATQQLTDRQVGLVIAAVCDVRFCLKRRLWTVAGWPVDPPEAKSLLPCLEPCPLLLEFARQARRWEQDEQRALPLCQDERETVRAALEAALARPPQPGRREADFGDPLNPRRVQWVRERIRGSEGTTGED